MVSFVGAAVALAPEPADRDPPDGEPVDGDAQALRRSIPQSRMATLDLIRPPWSCEDPCPHRTRRSSGTIASEIYHLRGGVEE
jgi:hypothetical protein